MGNRQFSNNASSLLAGTLTNTATTVALEAGFGAEFPTITGSQYFTITVQDTAGNIEYMKVTATSGDNLTVVRAQEGSTARGFTANLARVELRETAASLANFYQKDGDTLTGPLNGGNQTATNLVLSTGVSIENATEIVNTPIRGATGVTTNEIVVPSNGSAATMGGIPILVGETAPASFSIGMIIMWQGSVPDIPTGWSLCNGSNGTPNLQDKFVVGAGDLYSLDQSISLSVTGSTSAVSAGTPSISPFSLTTAQLPAHQHPFDYFTNGGSANFIVNPGGTGPSNQLSAQGGTGSRSSYAGSSVGTGATISPSGAALAAHSHTISGTVASGYGLYYIMYVG